MHTIPVNESDRNELAKLVKLVSKAKAEMALDQIHENGLTMEWLINLYNRIDTALKVASVPLAPTPTPLGGKQLRPDSKKTKG